MLLMPVFEGPSGENCTCVVLEPAGLAIANANRPDPTDLYDPGLYRAFQSLLYPYRDLEDELSADEPVIVLDLRSNPGGSSQYPTAWVWRLLYRQPRSQRLYANLTTDTAAALCANLLQHYSASSQMPADAAAFLRQDADSSRPGWSSIHHRAGTTVSNDPFIAVIIDPFIASAAEGLVLSLRHMDNVVFIGANTRGASFTGTVGPCSLPFSRLWMMVPVALEPCEGLTNRDGLGLLPDFWVDPDKALDRVKAFLEKHLVMEVGEAREANPLEGFLNP